MRRQVPCLAIVALLCCLKLSATEADSIAARVLQQFPGFHVVTLQERDPDARAWITKHFPRSDASVVHADFDGDGHPDLALLLKSDKSAASKLVILLCPPADQCRPAYQLDLGSVEGTYITSVRAGSKVTETEAEEDAAPSVRLKFTSIRLVYFEKAETVFYWNPERKQFEQIQTGD